MNKETVVGVLMGGLSSEYKISLKSGRAVSQALRDRGWTVKEIVVGRDLPFRLAKEEVEVAWIALHGRFGEDGCVQGLLEVMGIPYTGSSVRSAAVTMDKIATKRALQHEHSITMAEDWVCLAGNPDTSNIVLPAVVKPSVGGSTLGITLARNSEELERAVTQAFEYHDEVLVEEYVQGDEITVAVLDGVALPIIRIIPDSGFFDFEAKYTDGCTHYEVPAQIDGDTADRASKAAVRAYKELGCRGLARADFLVRNDGEPVFLEINTIPGMTATSLSPMAAMEAGIPFEELVETILLSATVMRVEHFPSG